MAGDFAGLWNPWAPKLQPDGSYKTPDDIEIKGPNGESRKFTPPPGGQGDPDFQTGPEWPTFPGGPNLPMPGPDFPGPGGPIIGGPTPDVPPIATPGMPMPPRRGPGVPTPPQGPVLLPPGMTKPGQPQPNLGPHMPQTIPNPEMDKFYEEMKAKGMTFPQIMDLWEQQHPRVGHQLGGPIYGVPPDLGAQPIYDKIGGQIDPMRHHTFRDFLRGGQKADPRPRQGGPTPQPGGTSRPGPDGRWISDGTVSNGWGGYFPAGTDITGYGEKWFT
jgi:hypothetical protein